RDPLVERSGAKTAAVPLGTSWCTSNKDVFASPVGVVVAAAAGSANATAEEARMSGCSSGGYQRPSLAIHQPGPGMPSRMVMRVAVARAVLDHAGLMRARNDALTINEELRDVARHRGS